MELVEWVEWAEAHQPPHHQDHTAEQDSSAATTQEWHTEHGDEKCQQWVAEPSGTVFLAVATIEVVKGNLFHKKEEYPCLQLHTLTEQDTWSSLIMEMSPKNRFSPQNKESPVAVHHIRRKMQKKHSDTTKNFETCTKA